MCDFVILLFQVKHSDSKWYCVVILGIIKLIIGYNYHVSCDVKLVVLLSTTVRLKSHIDLSVLNFRIDVSVMVMYLTWLMAMDNLH